MREGEGALEQKRALARFQRRMCVGLLILLVFAAVPLSGALAVKAEIPGQPELQRLGLRLLGIMRQGDVEGLIALLDQGIVLLDDEMPKEEAIQRLRDPQSLEYGYLFDSLAYRAAIVRQRLASGLSERQYQSLPPITSYRSVRDHLVSASSVTTKAELVRPATGGEPAVAVVTYDWSGRPDIASVGQCGFVLRPDGWKLYSPFSF